MVWQDSKIDGLGKGQGVMARRMSADLQPVGEPSGTVHRYILTFKIPPGRPVVQKTENNPGRIRLSTNHPSGDGLSLGLLLYSN